MVAPSSMMWRAATAASQRGACGITPGRELAGHCLHSLPVCCSTSSLTKAVRSRSRYPRPRRSGQVLRPIPGAGDEPREIPIGRNSIGPLRRDPALGEVGGEIERLELCLQDGCVERLPLA